MTPPQTPDTDRPVRVLLVDDDESDFVLTREVIADIPGGGYALDWESEFGPAVEAICRGEHDVYLVDYRLGEYTGLDVLAAIRARESPGPVILLTGVSGPEIDRAAEAAGAADFIEKGRLEPVLLERAIRYALRQRGQELELERKVAERTAALTTANDALADADRRKNEYLATLAHELRNPLAPIRNAMEIMRLAGENPTAMLKAREMIERQMVIMVRLLDDLLEVSRFTRDKLELTRERLDLNDTVRLAVESVQPHMDRAGVSFQMRFPDHPVPVDGDRVRLAQLVTNLLSNAAKYTPTGGNVSLTVQQVGAHAEVRVKDSGQGIPAAVLPRVFDLFSQVDKQLGRMPSGLGVGLAFVRRLTEMHGGWVTAASDGTDRGAEFVVTLPLARPVTAKPPR
jgi:signal transduction histidine kinase